MDMHQQPDKFTLAWWQQQFAEVLKAYRGATHAINRALADYEDCNRQVRELQERCRALEAERDAAHAKIGELQAKVVELTGRVDRMAEFLNKTKATNGAVLTPPTQRV